MLEAPHAIVGGAVGLATGNPYLAFPTGVASHYLLDLIPHWNPQAPFSQQERCWIYVDFAVSFGVVGLLWWQLPDHPEAAVGALAAMVPDLVLGSHYTVRVPKRYPGHPQRHVPARSWLGVPTQLAAAMLAIWVILGS